MSSSWKERLGLPGISDNSMDPVSDDSKSAAYIPHSYAQKINHDIHTEISRTVTDSGLEYRNKLTKPPRQDDESFCTNEYTERSFQKEWPKGHSPGYVALSSVKRKRQDSVESQGSESHLLAACEYESTFWTPPLHAFFKRFRVSYAEEALPDDEIIDDSFSCSATIADFENIPQERRNTVTLLGTKFISAVKNLAVFNSSQEKWFCETCRRPKDECQCLCTVS